MCRRGRKESAKEHSQASVGINVWVGFELCMEGKPQAGLAIPKQSSASLRGSALPLQPMDTRCRGKVVQGLDGEELSEKAKTSVLRAQTAKGG